ncbi:hypothetical protein [Halobacillus seohaensis]|uniref:Negative regulator of sigma-X activity n=1 Tax=Halobacillus seohaensis TaxID=447421 RepID=A0ABW2EHN9_9BACI
MGNDQKSEKEIQKMISDLPRVNESLNKGDYRKMINKKMKNNKKQRPQWLIPGLATILAIVIIAIVGPMTIDTINNEAIESNDQAVEENNTTEESNAAESANEDDTNKSDDSIETTEQNEPVEDAMLLDRLIVSDLDESRIVRAVPDQNAQYTIPLTIGLKGKSKEESLSGFSPEDIGLSQDILKNVTISVEEESEVATVIFPNDTEIVGSAMSNSIMESLRWSVEPYQVEEIQVETEGGEPVSFGNYGEVSTIDPIEENRYVYQLYMSNDREYLVPIDLGEKLSFEEALEEMKNFEESESVQPAIPQEMDIEVKEIESEIVVLQMSVNGSIKDRKLTSSLEAILASAKQFGYESIQFENVNGLEDLNFSEPVPVPESVNPIE